MAHRKLIQRLLAEEVIRLQLRVEAEQSMVESYQRDVAYYQDINEELRSDKRNLEFEISHLKLQSGEFTTLAQTIYNERPEYYRVNKIPFIKVLRERSGIGLKEAKDLVDQFMEGLPPQV